MLVYNIKRSINILGVPDLIAKLKNGTHLTRQKSCFAKNEVYKAAIRLHFLSN
jgi:hypothetical protein